MGTTEHTWLETALAAREVLAFGGPYVWVMDPVTLASDLDTASGSGKLEEDGILPIEQTGSKCRSTRSMNTERQVPSAASERTISRKIINSAKSQA